MARWKFLVVTSIVVGFASASARAQAPQEGSPPAPTQPAQSSPPQTPQQPYPAQALPPPSPSQLPPLPSDLPPRGYLTAPPGSYLTPPQPLPDLQPGDSGYRSPMTALALSLGLTLGGYGVAAWAQYKEREALSSSTEQASGTVRALGSAGSLVALIGPTSGHIYAGKTWNQGLKWRLISLGALTVTGVLFLAAAFSEGGSSDATISAFAVGVIASAAGYVAATIYEIATAPDAARQHNHRSANISVTIAPVIGREPGLAVIGRF